MFLLKVELVKSKSIRILVVLLIISLSGYFRIISDGSIRAVEFVSILSIGIIVGILVSQIYANQPK